ncbi:MAG: hypothetical protein AMJ60_06180 [Desulfobacterales bacterium SG8_35]|nr:MAG: hypothetical protein AMJ60_06180 [Desulfobacterales bacterium SG8_35]
MFLTFSCNIFMQIICPGIKNKKNVLFQLVNEFIAILHKHYFPHSRNSVPENRKIAERQQGNWTKNPLVCQARHTYLPQIVNTVARYMSFENIT